MQNTKVLRIKKIKLYSIIALLPLLFYIVNLYRIAVSIDSLFYYVLYPLGFIGWMCAIRLRRELHSIILYAGLHMLTIITNYLIIGNTTINSITLALAFLGITFLLFSYKWSVIQGAIVYYIHLLLMAGRLLYNGGRVLLLGSNNYVSVLIIIAASLYYIAVEREKNSIRLIDLLPAVLSFILSVWAGGRGGILSTAILMVLIVLLYIKTITNRSLRRTIVAVLCVLLGTIVLIITNTSLYQIFMSLGKWGSRGKDNAARIGIWRAYLLKTIESPRYLLLGAPFEMIPEILRYDGNCHNSFLQLHAFNGITMLLLFIVYSIRSFKSYISKHKYIYAILLLVIIVRGMTDKFIFGQYGMPIMVFLMLEPFVEKK